MPAPAAKDYTQKAPANVGLGLARSAGQGLLFGFGDEVEAFVRSRAEGAEYEDELKKVRSELEQFRKEAPVAAYGTEIITSIPSMLIGGAGLARAGVTGVGKIGAIESALYGAGVGEDIQERSIGAGVGAITGGVVSKAAQKILPQKSEMAKKLGEKGIALTPGQSLRDAPGIGSTLITALEDLTTSYPGAGAPIQAKRLETLIETNKALLEEAVEPLKIKIPKNLSPREAYEYVDDIVNKQYENVIKKLSIKETNQLETKILNIIDESILDVDEQSKVLKFVDKFITNKIDDGTIVGKNLKNAQTNLRIMEQRFLKKGGFEGEVGQVFKQIRMALEDQIDAENAFSVDLKKVNNVYGNLLPINEAMQAAIVQEGVYTPAQILRAIKKTDTTKRKKQLVKGQRPLQETAEMAQKVLGSGFPESGTASRLLAQDVIINPLKTAKLIGPAAASEILMSRPFGMSPATGLLTSLYPTARATTPAATALGQSAFMNNRQK